MSRATACKPGLPEDNRLARFLRFFRELAVDENKVRAYVAPTLRQAVERFVLGD